MRRPVFPNAPLRYLMASLLPLAAADCVNALLVSRYSADWGMWKLYLILMLFISGGYALATLAVAWLSRRIDAGLVLVQHVCLGVLLVLHNLLYYRLTPDWLAVAQGRYHLSPLQRVVYDRRTVWVMMGVSFALLAWRLYRRSRRGPPA